MYVSFENTPVYDICAGKERRGLMRMTVQFPRRIPQGNDRLTFRDYQTANKLKETTQQMQRLWKTGNSRNRALAQDSMAVATS